MAQLRIFPILPLRSFSFFSDVLFLCMDLLVSAGTRTRYGPTRICGESWRILFAAASRPITGATAAAAQAGGCLDVAGSFGRRKAGVPLSLSLVPAARARAVRFVAFVPHLVLGLKCTFSPYIIHEVRESRSFSEQNLVSDCLPVQILGKKPQKKTLAILVLSQD